MNISFTIRPRWGTFATTIASLLVAAACGSQQPVEISMVTFKRQQCAEADETYRSCDAALEMTNRSNQIISILGSESDSPFVRVGVLTNGNWESYAANPCATGTSYFPLNPGGSKPIQVWFPEPEVETDGPFRIGIHWQTIGNAKYGFKKSGVAWSHSFRLTDCQ